MKKEKVLEKIGLGIAFMFGIYWIYSVFIQEKLNIQPMFKTIIGLISLYGIGLFIFMKIIKKLPNTKIKQGKVSGKSIILCFLLQFTALIIMSLITNLFANISGKEITTE